MRLPEKGTKEFQNIINKGCEFYLLESSEGNQKVCVHEYDWSCMICPTEERTRRYIKETEEASKRYIKEDV